MNYYLIYVTPYLMTSEGTTIRTSRSLAAIEAALDTQADDGMPLHNFYAVYASARAICPTPQPSARASRRPGTRSDGAAREPARAGFYRPVLFDAPPPVRRWRRFSRRRFPARGRRFRWCPRSTKSWSAWEAAANGRAASARACCPTTVTLFDDPTLKQFQGQPLLGSYEVDDEGVKAQRVSLVENGILKNLLMSRRPGPDFQTSNGHARSALLSDTQPLASNLFLQSSDALKPADLKRNSSMPASEDGHEWCLEVKQMDNPALSSLIQQDFSDYLGELAGGISSGDAHAAAGLSRLRRRRPRRAGARRHDSKASRCAPCAI